MMTREQIKQRRREAAANTIYTVLLLIMLMWLLSMPADAAWHCAVEGVTTDQAVTGAIVWGAVLTGLIVRLDKPRHAPRHKKTPACDSTPGSEEETVQG